MFVFAGLQIDKPNDDLLILIERLNKLFSEQQLPVSFIRKDKLLTLQFEDVSFYISIFSDEREIKDWYQMAKDFELTAKPNPISNGNFRLGGCSAKTTRRCSVFSSTDRSNIKAFNRLFYSRIFFVILNHE